MHKDQRKKDIYTFIKGKLKWHDRLIFAYVMKHNVGKRVLMKRIGSVLGMKTLINNDLYTESIIGDELKDPIFNIHYVRIYDRLYDLANLHVSAKNGDGFMLIDEKGGFKQRDVKQQ